MTEPYRPTVLVVDDTTENLTILSGILSNEYRVLVAKTGRRAIELATHDPIPDIILLDVMMPEMDGYDVIRELKSDSSTSRIPVVFVTARGETEDETKGLELGAVDYLIKPVNPGITLARVRTHLENKKATDILTSQNVYLDRMVKERTAEILRTQYVAILAMSVLAETRDNETGNHIKRTEEYVRILAEELVIIKGTPNLVTPEQIDLMVRSAVLHDIGKVGIPDKILTKPARLTEEEYEIMKTHTTIGYEALVAAEASGDTTPFLDYAKQISLAHHEKWDGSGYPTGISGEEIPIPARIMALADVYDALISERYYKEPFTHTRARGIIMEGKGSHFDPDIVQAFLNREKEFQDVAIRFAGSEKERDAAGR